jgi:uncharacterized membrane protein YphA (DoxX/SURF4 family)
MVVAVIAVHSPHEFFMNWDGNQKGEGFEYQLLALGIAITLMIIGAGARSLDRVLATAFKFLNSEIFPPRRKAFGCRPSDNGQV